MSRITFSRQASLAMALACLLTGLAAAAAAAAIDRASPSRRRAEPGHPRCHHRPDRGPAWHCLEAGLPAVCRPMNADVLESIIQAQLPAAARGDAAAYGRIVAGCQGMVTAIALSIVRDVPASEDIAQDAFISAWQNLRKLGNPSSFLPWLRQITRNLARDHLRSQGYRANPSGRHRSPDRRGRRPGTGPGRGVVGKPGGAYCRRGH